MTGPKGEDGNTGEDGKPGQSGKPGEDGKDGVTPIIGIDADGYWTVNVGDGIKRILVDGKPVSALGQKGDNGQQGDKGYSFFSKVETDETCVTFTLSDGSSFTVPRLGNDTYIRFADSSDLDIYYGYNKTLEIESEGIRSALITAPCGWTASVNISSGKVKVSAPFFTETDSEFEGYVSIIAVTDDGYTLTESKAVRRHQGSHSERSVGYFENP